MVFIHNLVPFLIASGVIALVLIVFQFALGKDKRPAIIKAEYNLPHGLTPALAGTLIDESADIVDVIATIFDLDARGYVELVPVKKNKYFAGDEKKTDVLIKVLKKDLKGLNEYEADIMSFILEQHSLKEQVFLNDFGMKFAHELNQLRKKIEDEATKIGLFDAPPYSVRNFFTAFYIFMLIIAYILIFKSGSLEINMMKTLYNPFAPFLGVFTIIIYSSVPLLLTLPLYIRLKKSVALRTDKGVDVWGRILGLREFIKKVEKERIRLMAEKDPKIFKKILPYAVILGLTREWAHKMEKEYIEYPGWLSSMNEAEQELIMETLEIMAGRRKLVFLSPDQISPVQDIWDTLDHKN